jgi:hypothetical protein
MPRATVNFDRVRRLALALPDVEAGTTWGALALKIRGSLMACVAIHKSAEPNTLAVRIDFDQRAELLAADPETYYLTDHYVNYPVVLVRLSSIHPDALRDLLGMSWRFVTSRTKCRRRSPRKPKARRSSASRGSLR